MTISRKAALAAASATAIVLAGCSDPFDEPEGDGGGEASGDDDTIVVSSGNFVESEILGNLFAETLRDAGIEVEERFNIGARETYIPALEDGSIDLVPDYTGNLLLYLDPEADVSPGADVQAALDEQVEELGLSVLEPAEAENTDTVTVTSELAEEWDLTEIGDLAEHNDELILAGPPEFNERDRGIPGLEELYGVEPDEFVAIADGGGPATVQALLDGDVHGANIFSTSPEIEENDLVTLEDPEGNFPEQFVVPLIKSSSLTPEIEEALGKLTAELTTAELTSLNARVSGEEKLEPKQAAIEWLEEKGIIG